MILLLKHHTLQIKNYLGIVGKMSHMWEYTAYVVVVVIVAVVVGKMSTCMLLNSDALHSYQKE